MAARDHVIAAAVLLAAGACGSNPPQPVTLSPQTLSTPAPPNPSTPPVTPPSAPSPRASRDEAIARGEAVVIDATPEAPTADIVAAAQAERARRRDVGLPVAVITDKNLAQYASGSLTFQDGSDEEADEASTESEAGDGASALRHQRDEEYWRSEALAARTRWRAAWDEARELELQAAELRQRFYAEDDPYVRDGQIKPEWDRTLDRLAVAREAATKERRGIDDLLEAGRRAGAFPGWLREGEDIEPEGDTVAAGGDSAAPNEPAVAEEQDLP